MKHLRFLYIVFVFLLVVSFTACKTSRVLSGRYKAMPAGEILSNYHNNQITADALSLRFDAETSNAENIQSANLYVRMYRDSLIWISVRVMSLEGMRAVLTPDSVKLLMKDRNEYYAGGYEFLSRQFGLNMSFESVQSIFLAELIDYGKYGEKNLKPCNDSLYYCLGNAKKREFAPGDSMAPFDPECVIQKYHFSPDDFSLVTQCFTSILSREELSIRYGEMQVHGEYKYPESIELAVKGYRNSMLRLKTRNVSVRDQMKTPFKIPDKYQRISF